MPLSFHQKCLSHETSANDKQLVMRLFKLACLKYEPSDFVYRDQEMSREQLLVLRSRMLD